MRYSLLFIILCLSYIIPPFRGFASESDSYEFRKMLFGESLHNGQVCNTQIEGYNIPRKLLKQYIDDGSININMSNFVIIMNMYSDDIDDFIARPISSDYNYLECAYNLNKSEEKLLNNYFNNLRIEVIRNNTIPSEQKSLGSNLLINPMQQGTITRICRQYNKIAFSFEKNNMYDQAEEVYRYVISEYSIVEGCQKEAEISLVKLNDKRAFFSNLREKKTTIAEGEGSACMGKDKTRKQVEQMALLEAKRKTVEYVSTHITSETRAKNFEIDKDIISAYANTEVRVIQKIGNSWFKERKFGNCYRVKIKAEVIPSLKR